MTTTEKKNVYTNHIIYTHGLVDALNYVRPGDGILVPVSCDGEVNPKSMAAIVAKHFPLWAQRYTRVCHASKLFPGKILYNSDAWDDRNIIAFPTKVASKGSPQLHVIEASLQKLVETFNGRHITGLVVTKMGCSKNGLKWEEVGPLVVKYLSQLSVPITICIGEKDTEYHLDPEGNLIEITPEDKMEHDLV
jgi:hypothetical protein